jgi:uncharacterized 2Fe-2S/4Fe-4S cluster protein (DUF4445 family)
MGKKAIIRQVNSRSKLSNNQQDIITIVFEPHGVKSKFKKGITILDVLAEMRLGIRSECGGKGICGKCKIIVKEPQVFSRVNASERKRLSVSELKSGYRLACACSALDSAVVFVPEESRMTTRKFLVVGTEIAVNVEPAIRKVYLEIPKPSLSDVRSDVQRLKESLKEIYEIEACNIDYKLLEKLPESLRKANWNVTVTIWSGEEIISVEPGDKTDKAYGIAIDIGTSKIISYLVNLTNGKLVATASLENPQIMHGEDIVSRITYASQSASQLKELQRLVVEGVNKAITDVCRKSKVSLQYIYEITLVGNTAMHHIFLGLQPRYLGLAPYVPVISSPINKKARDFSIKTNVANIHVLPVVAGFVGADVVADIIATGIHESDVLSMMVDIGTNTEVLLGNKYGIAACSCASGPAFEGMHVKCGMKATTGAVEKLRINPEDHVVSYETIGNVKPRGLCGSGIIDAIANLLKFGIIDKSGKFASGLSISELKTINGEKSFILIPKKEAACDIVITQKDIREIQLAKAAIYTGCHILMKRKNVELGDIKKFYVAGAFGNYINLENAKYIGMLPDIPTESITFVGNSAGTGARIALISKLQRQIADSLNQKVDYLELGLDPSFQKEFVSATCFPHEDLNRFPSLKNESSLSD